MSRLKKFSTCFPQVSGVLSPVTLQSPHFLITTPSDMQGLRCSVFPSPQTHAYSRRHTFRVETPDGVWVYWRCNGVDALSLPPEISFGGLFRCTTNPQPWGRTPTGDSPG